jgi:hypothetical protein
MTTYLRQMLLKRLPAGSSPATTFHLQPRRQPIHYSPYRQPWLILQPGPAALTDGLDAIVAALLPQLLPSSPG